MTFTLVELIFFFKFISDSEISEMKSLQSSYHVRLIHSLYLSAQH